MIPEQAPRKDRTDRPETSPDKTSEQKSHYRAFEVFSDLGKLVAAPLLGLTFMAEPAPAQTFMGPPPVPLQIPNKNKAAPDTTNLIPGVDAAIELAKQGQINGTVREIQSEFSGQFSYEMAVKAQLPLPEQKMLLRGVTSGDERNRLLKGLAENGVVVRADSPAEPTSNSGPSNGNSARPSQASVSSGPNIDVGTVLTGVIAVALVAGLVMTLRSRREQREMAKGQMDEFTALGKHRGEVLKERPKERFSDIGGIDHILDELNELGDDIRAVMKGNNQIQLPRGIVVSGGPGTGKTMLFRALAGEMDVPFIHFDSSQFTQMLKGTGPARVRSGFEEARRLRDELTHKLQNPHLFDRSIKQPNPHDPDTAEERAALLRRQGVCIMFFDEFDSIGSRRDQEGIGGSDDERKNVVNSLLNEMDGLNKLKNHNIIVAAATNFRDALDSALMRPGRFTKKIDVPMPSSVEQRLDILEKQAKHVVYGPGKKFEDDECLRKIAIIGTGKTGDDLRAILQESMSIIRREGRDVITNHDLFESFQRTSYGRLKRNYLSEQQRELVAGHEHGHGLAAFACGINLFIVSMMPRGESAGRVVLDPQGIGEVLTTRNALLKRILIGAGGRAAEQELYGEGGITQGASMDLKQIRALVRSMISVGMLADQYALEPDQLRQHQTPQAHLALIDNVTKAALRAAGEIVQAVGPERMDKLIKDSLSLNRELVGEEAQAFYNERIDPETRLAIENVAKKFMRDPLGESAKKGPAASAPDTAGEPEFDAHDDRDLADPGEPDGISPGDQAIA